MKTLIVEDDFVSRKMLQKILQAYGDCDIAANGREAIQAFVDAQESRAPYDLICLDIMMPEMNGLDVVTHIRTREEQRGIGGLEGVKIIMTSGLDDSGNILGAFRSGAEAYLIKPVDHDKLLERLRDLKLIAKADTGKGSGL